MTALVIQAAIFAAAFILVVRHFIARFERAEHNWTQERSLLLTRIQHPERVVTPVREDWRRRRPRSDQIGHVGRIDLAAPRARSDSE